MQAGVVVAERFEVEREAAAGGMSVVYKARDRLSGLSVALKVLSPQAVDDLARFHREARLLAELGGTGIVRYVDHGTTDHGHSYLAMEWLEGESLSDRLARAPLTILESVQLVGRIAQALAPAHVRGIVHRDLKPSNLFLPGGELADAKLLDFGIARLQSATRVPTMTGVLMGTPGYMAPEQARGHAVDARTDVFALGCVLYECLAGRPVFIGEHIMALLAKILIEDAPRVATLRPDVPPALDALVARMLAKDPDVRPADAAAVVSELERLEATASVSGTGEPTPFQPKIALTQREQRLVCVLLAGEADDGAAKPRRDATLQALQRAAGPFGGRLDQLVNGSIVWALSGSGVATDQAAHAARCALAVRAVLPRMPMVLATGRGVVSEHWSTGEVIDRAARILRGGAPDPAEGKLLPIRLDEVTAGLLDARFVIGQGRTTNLLELSGEREAIEVTRTLLGKPTPCVGRDRELGTLDAIWSECVNEPIARAVLLTGPAGVGKSRLRHELLSRVHARGEPVEIWYGRGDLMKIGSPFGLIAPALRLAAGVLDGEPLKVRQLKLRARVARHVPKDAVDRVVPFLGELCGVPFGDDDSAALRAARGNAMLMSDQMRRAWEDLVAAECAAGPLLIVLEDLQWGDLPTVKLIDVALRNLRDRPLMVLALSRPEVHDLFPQLWRERGLIETSVGELTKKASEKLVRSVLGATASDADIAQIVSQADGNAFYLEELIRAVSERPGSGALPETVVAMVQARLERLEPEARRVLRAASVFGQVFWRGGVMALLGVGSRASQLNDWLAELVAREMIIIRKTARFPGETEYVFRHALVREAAYAMLIEGDRHLGHALAAGWLEQAGEPDPVALAEHFERAEIPDLAVRHYLRAAAQALEGHDLEAALLRARRGIDCGAEAELGALRLIEAEAHAWRGEHADAAASGTQAMEWLAPKSPAWFTAATHVVEATSRMGELDRLVALGEELATLAKDSATIGSRQAIAMGRAITQLTLGGKVKLADVLAEELARTRGDFPDEPEAAAWFEDAFAVRALFAGDLGGYLTGKGKVVAAFARAGLSRVECVQRARFGYANMEIGDFGVAVHELRAALRQAQDLSLNQPMALAKHNLGLALARLGQLPEAQKLEEEAVEMYRLQGDRRLEGASHFYLSTILALGGDLAGAEREVQAGLAVAPDKSPVWALGVAQLARVRLAMGQVEEAYAAARSGMDVLVALGGLDEGEALVRLMHAETLYAHGAHDEARAAITAAHERLLTRAGKISDPALRESFLHNIPENARTAELRKHWS